MMRQRFGQGLARSDAVAAVSDGVAVRDRAPDSRPRNADPVARPRNGREVEGGENRFPGGRKTEEGDHALRAVAEVDPLESRRIEIELVESPLFPIEPIQI